MTRFLKNKILEVPGEKEQLKWSKIRLEIEISYFWIMYMTLLRVNLKYKQTAWIKALEALRSLGGDSQLTV